MQLSECSISGHNLVYQLPSDRRGLLVPDGETLKPFRKIAPHHEAVLVPRRGDGVGPGYIHCQAFHRDPDDVLMSPSFPQHRAVAFGADPAHVSAHPRPVKTLFCQREGACNAQMSSYRPSMETLENNAAPVHRNDQLGPPSLSLQLMEPSV